MATNAASAASATKPQNLTHHLFTRLLLEAAESRARTSHRASSLAGPGAQQFRMLRPKLRPTQDPSIVINCGVHSGMHGGDTTLTTVFTPAMRPSFHACTARPPLLSQRGSTARPSMMSGSGVGVQDGRTGREDKPSRLWRRRYRCRFPPTRVPRCASRASKSSGLVSGGYQPPPATTVAQPAPAAKINTPRTIDGFTVLLLMNVRRHHAAPRYE